MKKKLMKKTAAAVLALALVGGVVPAANLVGFSLENTAVAADEADADQSWFDAKTSTLYLKGSIVNQVKSEKRSDGVKLPEGVEKESVLHVVVDESAVFPENCMGLFGNIANVESIDLTGADTSNVTNMAKMFAPTWLADVAKLTPLKSIYFSEDFDTSKVTDMHGMFTKQDSLTELDLSSFDTSNVKDMKEMFILCTTLKRIFVSDSWTTDAIPKYGAPDYNRGDMNVFMGCVNLRGGNGTTYDYEKSNGDRAMIDKVAQTGYFTQAPTYLSEPKYKQTADNGMIHYIRYIFVVPKSELSGKEKAVITAEYNGVKKEMITSTYYTGVTTGGEYYKVGSSSSVLFVVTIAGVPADDESKLSCSIDFE